MLVIWEELALTAWGDALTVWEALSACVEVLAAGERVLTAWEALSAYEEVLAAGERVLTVLEALSASEEVLAAGERVFQWHVVILYHDMPAIDEGMELLKAEAHWQALTLDVHIVSLNVSKTFTGKSYGATTLDQGSL